MVEIEQLGYFVIIKKTDKFIAHPCIWNNLSGVHVFLAFFYFIEKLILTTAVMVFSSELTSFIP